jgi:hypothetical protein
VPFEPDCNLVCLAINPRGNHGVAGMNRFMRALQARLSADPAQPLQRGAYFGSVTTLGAAALGLDELRALAAALGIDPADLDPDDPARDRLVVLRHTLMNPFLRDDTNGISYIDGYFAWLERQVDELLAGAAA